MDSSRLPNFISTQLRAQILKECEHFFITHSDKRSENGSPVGQGRSRKQITDLAKCVELAIEVVRGRHKVDGRFCCDWHVFIEDQKWQKD